MKKQKPEREKCLSTKGILMNYLYIVDYLALYFYLTQK